MSYSTLVFFSFMFIILWEELSWFHTIQWRDRSGVFLASEQNKRYTKKMTARRTRL
jgi:hypothetical protein